jgi:Domain of unknown function (DUF4157)
MRDIVADSAVAAPVRSVSPHKRVAGPSPGLLQRRPGPGPGTDLVDGLENHCPCGGGCPKCAAEVAMLGHADDPLEREAERVAEAVSSSSVVGVRQSTLGAPQVSRPEVPDDLAAGLSSLGVGEPLDAEARRVMERRLGHDFANVRVHHGPRANRLTRLLDARALTRGVDIVFGEGEYAPKSERGRFVLGHELAHVVQQRRLSAPFGVVQPYRAKSAFNFGRNDSATMKEEEFKDAKTQPWIETVSVKFDGSTTDTNGDVVPTGTATAEYLANAAALSSVSVPVTGGSTSIGLTDGGSFTVTRIEGVGYSDVPLSPPEGEGPRRKYSRTLAASMSYAVFFHRGQALHIGALNLGSHACVHMGTDAAAWDRMRQINYHSVVGRTKVRVSYDPAALSTVCCARMTFLGVKRKGGAPNPCHHADPAHCPPSAGP